MKPLARLAALAGALLLPVALAAPAHADSWSKNDATGDVWLKPCSSKQTCAKVSAPGVTEGDIASVAVRHARYNVFITTSFVDISQDNPFNFSVGAIHSAGRTDLIDVYWDGATVGAVLARLDGSRIRCSFGRTVDFTANTITVRIPRSCLGRPGWVQYAAMHAYAVGESEIYYDQMGSTRVSEKTPVWSPRLYRG